LIFCPRVASLAMERRVRGQIGQLISDVKLTAGSSLNGAMVSSIM
jgi:hypothetical protein